MYYLVFKLQCVFKGHSYLILEFSKKKKLYIFITYYIGSVFLIESFGILKILFFRLEMTQKGIIRYRSSYGKLQFANLYTEIKMTIALLIFQLC